MSNESELRVGLAKAEAVQAEWRQRAESAEAEVARLTRLLEQRTAALTRTIDAKDAAESALDRARMERAQAEDAETAAVERADTAEAKVTRVEALVGTWSCGRCDDYMVFCHEGCWYADDLRAALDGGQP